MLGGNFSDPVVVEICQAASDLGLATLRFNFRGVGDSQGEFTNGKEDTYPSWIQQEVKNIRKDVTILNIDLLHNQQYRDNIYTKAGLTKTTSSISDLIQKTLR